MYYLCCELVGETVHEWPLRTHNDQRHLVLLDKSHHLFYRHLRYITALTGLCAVIARRGVDLFYLGALGEGVHDGVLSTAASDHQHALWRGFGKCSSLQRGGHSSVVLVANDKCDEKTNVNIEYEMKIACNKLLTSANFSRL